MHCKRLAFMAVIINYQVAGDNKKRRYSYKYPVNKIKFRKVLCLGKALGKYPVKQADDHIQQQEYKATGTNCQQVLQRVVVTVLGLVFRRYPL